MRKFHDGENVFVNNPWLEGEECIVMNCTENESSTGKNVYQVQSRVIGGIFGVTEDCVFATLEEARKASIEASDKLVQKYKNKIKTLKDLIEFPLQYCISGGEEYTNWEAQKAYKIRASELTGTVL